MPLVPPMTLFVSGEHKLIDDQAADVHDGRAAAPN